MALVRSIRQHTATGGPGAGRSPEWVNRAPPPLHNEAHRTTSSPTIAAEVFEALAFYPTEADEHLAVGQPERIS